MECLRLRHRGGELGHGAADLPAEHRPELRAHRARHPHCAPPPRPPLIRRHAGCAQNFPARDPLDARRPHAARLRVRRICDPRGQPFRRRRRIPRALRGGRCKQHLWHQGLSAKGEGSCSRVWVLLGLRRGLPLLVPPECAAGRHCRTQAVGFSRPQDRRPWLPGDGHSSPLGRRQPAHPFLSGLWDDLFQ